MARGLASRVADNATAQANDGSIPMSEQIRRMESQFALAMPRGGEAAQLVRDALTTLRGNPKLAECDAATVLGGLMTCAQLNLRPGVLGHAWLIPFWNSRKSRYEAQLVIGYQGLVDLAHRSGRIASLIARTVYENDHFDVDYGLADSLVHKPTLKGDKGAPVAYYAIAKFTTGGHAFIVVPHDEMLAYKQQFAMAKTREGKIIGPWEDHFEAMAQKTCVRQLAKWMPKSTELATAIEADNSVRVDISPTADPAVVSQHPVITAHVEYPPATTAPDDQADADTEPATGTAADREQLSSLTNKMTALGITGRVPVNSWLSAALERPVANRNDLTASEADTAIMLAQQLLDERAEGQQ